MPASPIPATSANSPLLLQATQNYASRPLATTTPGLTPQGSSLQVPQLNSFGKKRLLIPAIRCTGEIVSPKPAFIKPSASKVARSRSSSLPPSPDPTATLASGIDGLGFSSKFEIVEDQIEMEGYQIYAVEKWVVERTRPVTVLVVYTGDPTHKITVTALALISSHTLPELQLEWDKTLQVLRRDGARPKETDKGILMVTSLANFRPDFTIVQLPNGNSLDVWEQLYTNINLLRMGCSGRSALTLQEPSDTTKYKFISMYHIQDKVRSKELFKLTVLELVKFIQSGLAVFGMFDMVHERNGLLCDVTVDGIQRWIIEIGEPCVHVESTERLVDPSIVSALLSLVLAMRNKLCDIGFGQVPPRDPFLDPAAFVAALTGFYNSRHNLPASSPQRFATVTMIDALNAAHDKFRQTESFKVHRVLKSKLDDLATDLRAASHEGLHTSNATPDLNMFVKSVLSGGKDGSINLVYLWSGRPLDIRQERKEKVQSDGEREDDFERERCEKIDGKYTDDEHEFLNGNHWSGRMQRRIEAWTALGRGKKMSVDFGSRGWPWIQPAESVPQNVQTPPGPTVIISGEDEDIVSSGRASPVYKQRTAASSAFGFDAVTAESSVANLSEYDRRVTEFNQKRPLRYPAPHRIVSWSDPVSMRVPSQLGKTDSSEKSWDGSPDASLVRNGETSRKRPLVVLRSQRRRSFGDSKGMKNMRVLPLERMKIDVELCGQLLIMRRREMHLQSTIACLSELAFSLSETNTHLREEYQAHSRKLGPFLERGGVINDIEAARIKSDSIAQETNALQYESEQFQVKDLWNLANPPRQKVLELREKVFGMGRRLPQGVHGADGRFNRVQWTLDGAGRLVDWLGRTESDVEEEGRLDDVIPSREHEDEQDVVEHPVLKPTWLLKLSKSLAFGTGWARSSRPKIEEPADTSVKLQPLSRPSSPTGSLR